jgi:insertion element IS1 protein InsB
LALIHKPTLSDGLLLHKDREKYDLSTVDGGIAAMTIEITCPSCASHDISKNGTVRKGQQNCKFRGYGLQFMEELQWQPKGKDTIDLVHFLLLEKVSFAGITRATQASVSWLQEHVNDACAKVARTASVLPNAKAKLTTEQMDELWLFVDDKGHKQWIWLAMDADTRELIGCHVGNRSRASAPQLWQSLPTVCRQCAQAYANYWNTYETVISRKRRFAVGKDSGLTSDIERLNKIMRQWVSRLVGKDLVVLKEVRESHWCDLDIHLRI